MSNHVPPTELTIRIHPKIVWYKMDYGGEGMNRGLSAQKTEIVGNRIGLCLQKGDESQVHFSYLILADIQSSTKRDCSAYSGSVLGEFSC